MPNQAIRNLVFQGGSVKGVAYVGALEALAANAYLANVQRVAGTSAGSIFAALFALGCDIVRVNEILSTFDFKALLDDPAKGIPTQSKVLKSVEKAEHTSLFFAKIPAKTVKTPIAYRVLSQKGIYDGEFFRLWMEARIQEQVKNLTNGEHDGEHLTFAELHALTEKYPGVFRDLFVVGSNLTLSKKRVFSYDNPETEHVIISDAIRISMSIPNIFLPHHVHCKMDGQRLIDTKLEEWVDGGLYDNYPIDCFDHQKYMSSELIAAEDGKLYNPETLGFRLVNNERQAYYEGVSEYSPTNNVTHALPFNRALINAREALQEERYSRKEHIERTVYIDHLGISTLAFNLPESDQHALIVSGKEATERYFAKRKTAQNGCDESPSPAV